MRKTTDSKPRIAIAIMAAGKGTRLKSKHPKVLHPIGGKSLLAHVIAAATQIVPAKDVYAIVGHEAKRVQEAVASTGVQFVMQEPQRGTGHALMAARQSLADYDHVIVLSGDAPLITAQTIARLRDAHLGKKSAMTLLSADLSNPTGYGRILRKGKSDAVAAIVEEKSATPAQKKIREINAGFYVFAVRPLYTNIEKLATANAHNEYYLTDMAALLTRAKAQVIAYKTENPAEILGSNTRAEMVALDATLRLDKCRRLMTEGVTIFYPETCVIDSEVEVGPDTVIQPSVQLYGKTRIGSDCVIESYSIIRDSEIGDGVYIQPGCVIEHSQVERSAKLGPYSHLRPQSVIGEGAHVGNFVETKKTRLGKGSKANHLTYLGDADIGDGVNIGAGTITCNYDGVHKHGTTIGDGAFVGSDSTLVAPVKIGNGAYVGAASCITQDVPAESLALGRAQQIVKEGWVKKRREAQKQPKSQ